MVCDIQAHDSNNTYFVICKLAGTMETLGHVGEPIHSVGQAEHAKFRNINDAQMIMSSLPPLYMFLRAPTLLDE